MVKHFEFAFAEFLEETGRINFSPEQLLTMRAAFLAGWCIMAENFRALGQVQNDDEAVEFGNALIDDSEQALQTYMKMFLEHTKTRTQT